MSLHTPLVFLVFVLLLATLTGCSTLRPEVQVVVRRVEVEVLRLPPLNPLLKSSTELPVGSYEPTAFERKAVREIFGPPVARWADKYIRVGKESEFRGQEADASAFYRQSPEEIVLRARDSTSDSWRFANLIHEVTHYWEFHQYKHPQSVNYSKYSTEQVYKIPDEWTNLNIEQEAEMVSLYAVVTYLFTRDDQTWDQFGNNYSRDDLPRIEDYMRREMYF